MATKITTLNLCNDSNSSCACVNPFDVPSLFNNDMTYLEYVGALTKKINEIIEYINQYQDDYKNYTDIAITNLKAYVDSQNLDLKTYVDNSLQSSETKLNDAIAELNEKMNTLTGDLYDYVNGAIEQIYKYIDEYYQFNVKVYSPVSGEWVSVGTAFDQMYDALRYFGITAGDFDSKEFTCDQFEALLMSASRFDLYSWNEYKLNPLFYMSDPWTGEKAYYQDVIYQIVNEKQNTITASAYDALKLTASVYDAKAITAYDYDWNSASLLTS